MQEVKDIYEKLENCTVDEERIELLAELSALFLHHDMNRCMEVVEQLLHVGQTTSLPKAFAYYHSGLGRIYFKQSKFVESLEAFKAAVQFAREANSPMLESNCYHSLGMVYWKEGMFDESLEMSQKALEFFNDENDGTGNKALCYNSLGNIYERLGEYDKAEQAYLDGMRVLKNLQEERLVANIKGNLGVIKLRKREYAEALEYLEPVYEGFKKIKHATGEILTLVHLGHAHTGLRAFAKAMKLYLQALKEIKQNEYKFAEAEAHKGIGYVYVGMDGHEEALKHYEKGMEIVKAVDYQSGVCEFHMDYAEAYRQMGNIAKALEHVEEGLAIARQKKLPFETRRLEHLLQELLAEAKVA